MLNIIKIAILIVAINSCRKILATEAIGWVNENTVEPSPAPTTETFDFKVLSHGVDLPFPEGTSFIDLGTIIVNATEIDVAAEVAFVNENYNNVSVAFDVTELAEDILFENNSHERRGQEISATSAIYCSFRGTMTCSRDGDSSRPFMSRLCGKVNSGSAACVDWTYGQIEVSLVMGKTSSGLWTFCCQSSPTKVWRKANMKITDSWYQKYYEESKGGNGKNVFCYEKTIQCMNPRS